MSGHSKWSNIKRKKEKSDAQKGKIFTKIGRELSVAVRQGGPDPATNSKLKECISKAKSFNVPNENIKNIIRKAASGSSESNCESLNYEGFGPENVAFIVSTLTNNKNRTSSNIRMYFDKSGGGLGSVSFMFDEKGEIIIERNQNINEDEVFNDSLESGASDFYSYEDSFVLTTEKSDFENVKREITGKGYEIMSSEIAMVPKSCYVIKNPEIKEKISNFIDTLENDEDVQCVWSNYGFEE